MPPFLRPAACLKSSDDGQSGSMRLRTRSHLELPSTAQKLLGRRGPFSVDRDGKTRSDCFRPTERETKSMSRENCTDPCDAAYLTPGEPRRSESGPNPKTCGGRRDERIRPAMHRSPAILPSDAEPRLESLVCEPSTSAEILVKQGRAAPLNTYELALVQALARWHARRDARHDPSCWRACRRPGAGPGTHMPNSAKVTCVPEHESPAHRRRNN